MVNIAFQRVLKGLRRSRSSAWLPTVIDSRNEVPIHGVPDIAASIMAADRGLTWTVAAASMRGRGHALLGEPRQDSYSIFNCALGTVAAVFDGVSSSPRSHLAAQIASDNFEEIFKRTVNSENLLKTSIWDELNEALSKEIAKRYVKVARANDVALEQEPSALREQAADEMATSAEIVILRNHEDGEQEKSYVYARLAGDGGLFLISRAGISRKYPTDLELGQVKGPIEALPAAYSNPVLVEGNLAKSETLLLCTDGVADFIEASSKWQKMLRKASALGTMSYRQLVELVLLDHADNQDDKTLILMR